MHDSIGSQHQSDAAAAVERLLAAHGGLLYQLAYRFCGNRDDADDLVQDVFLSVYRSWHTFRGDADERTWLYRIAARACQRMHRPKAHQPDHIGSLDAALPFGEPRIAMIPAELDDGLQHQIHKEARARLEAEIAGLPDEFRVPLVLKEIVGMSLREVAEVLGLPEATARSRVHRARLKLRAAVDSTLPRTSQDVPPPAYETQTCLDLLNAKQDALDRGVPFDSSVICQRCRSVFASLDLTQELCRDLGGSAVPRGLRERLLERIANAADGRTQEA